MPERRHCGGHCLFFCQANEVAMRFSISGLMKLKPFDESLDVRRTERVYGSSWAIGVGIVETVALLLMAIGSALPS